MLVLIFGFIVLVLLVVIAVRVGRSAPDKNSTSPQKKCPQCAEYVKEDALICRFCGYEFPEETTTPDSIIGAGRPIVGEERKKLMEAYNIKYSPIRNAFKQGGKWFQTFEEAAQYAEESLGSAQGGE